MIKKLNKKFITQTTCNSTSKEDILDSAIMNDSILLNEYRNSYSGYSEKMVNIMRNKYGSNEITQKSNNSMIKKFVKAFINPFTIVLLILAIISFITDVILANPTDKNATTVIIVLTMVTISGLLQFIQESRSGKAAQALSDMVNTTISVMRDSKGLIEIPLREVVVGDIIHIAAGDMIPADVRILQCKDLFVSQSSLTGESEPIEKFSDVYKGTTNNILDLDNIAFMGSNIISGSAIAIVISVGDCTIFGSMAQQITSKKTVTGFEKGVNSVSWLLIRFMFIMVPIVLFVNGFTKGNWMEAFLFALSIAVGLTPEMLPMLVSANLAKGAVAMSKKKVIVKDLGSIQNFGAMDILCTDKTGTLTKDKVVLEYSLDIHGKEDKRILRHAFLNSYHQTGLKNLMDIAIINHANDNGMQELWRDYTKIDEIPFDFNRRRMSVVVKNKFGKTQLITKGAIEEMLSICTHVEYKNEIQLMTDEICKEVIATVSKYNDKGMRVLGIAQKNNPSPIDEFSVSDESNMVLIGYLAFLDPPKESTSSAVKALLKNGVDVKVLTGDNDAVTKCICKQVGIKIENILLGSDIEGLDDKNLDKMVEHTSIFAKLSPEQKSRIVESLRRNGHIVGFMGDGINDAAAMKASDVGISVDTAVDIAKECANIILLEKDLMVLEQGAIEGRKTYANIIKYIKMTASSNFGNMFSVLIASAFLPFLPMLPIQLLILNLIYDISCITIPWDNVDDDYLKIPRKWDSSSISKFMTWIGPTSSVFDITTYILMYFVVCPNVFGGSFHSLDTIGQLGFISLFHAGWFVESLWSQTLVIHMIRTPHIPFIKSRASWKLTLFTTMGIVIGTIIPYTSLGHAIGMMPLPGIYFIGLIFTILSYMVLVTILKKVFVKRYGELL
ncbi:magnesium-translocating P-type ATPase [Clostridioides sp. GD02404]|uniref:magnesium-translocating P-type ATPase n=1 Tax=Clostridioides sp. GD02404 TaxID=3054354 RepID=UPI00389F880F